MTPHGRSFGWILGRLSGTEENPATFFGGPRQ
jgi:hypothetical protein